jgi:uroporphyrin-III C-methyltransferase/precorrin-2 dehydrogenase/sirohydrochlorin ferrochelatase
MVPAGAPSRIAICRERRRLSETAANASASPALHPAFLKLAGRKVVLVGGGPVAAAKHAALVPTGAALTVVAPAIQPALRTPGTTLVERPFVPADLDGAWFVVAAAPAEVNRAVLAAAEARQLFVNAVDDPTAATAYAGAVVRRGDFTLVLSTGGAAPALAGLVREGLEVLLPDDLAAWSEEAQRLRATHRSDGVPMSDRRPLLLEAINRRYAGRTTDEAAKKTAEEPR